jgi:uncharacterized repeat protein (TIGR01451 family)
LLKRFILFFLFCASIACSALVCAAPTLAGTVISNQAQLHYSVDGVAQTPTTSNIVSFTVLEIVNMSLVWQDAVAVHVSTPQQNAPLAFTLTNTGNGTQSYNVLRDNAIVGDQFDPSSATAGAIFIENGLLAGFQATGPNADTAYIVGSNGLALAPGESRIIYIVSDIPSGLAIGNLGSIGVRVESRTIGVAGSLPGSTHPNITQVGQISTGLAVTGLTQGQASSIGTYVVDGVVVVVNKTIVSPTNANNLIPGTELKYRVLVDIQGTGSVQNLIINDPLPSQLTYVPNSIILDAVSKTDAADTDNAEFLSNTVSVNLGNVTAPASFVIEFRTTLK